MTEFKRIGVLTSGGDAPGMNAAVRAVTRLASLVTARTAAFIPGASPPEVSTPILLNSVIGKPPKIHKFIL